MKMNARATAVYSEGVVLGDGHWTCASAELRRRRRRSPYRTMRIIVLVLYVQEPPALIVPHTLHPAPRASAVL
jgi:hypothetical protein